MNLLQKFKSTGFLLFLFVFLCCAIFYSPGSWNQAARDDMVYSVVENGTFSIDRFMVYPDKNYNTGDWARYNGHYYSNKAPGSSFIGILVYFPVYHLEKIFLEKITPGWDIFNAYWINLWASVIPTAFAAFVLFKLLLLLGLSERRSFFFASCYALATPVWPYSTIHWGHPTSAAFLIFSLYFLLKGKRRDLCLAGFFSGCAVLTEYSAILAAACFGIYLLITGKKKCLFFISGGLLPAIVYMWYHYVCFGSPFANAASFSNPVFIKGTDTLGLLGTFHLFNIFKLLFSVERGLLLMSPILLFAFSGTRTLWKSPNKKLVYLLWGWIISGLLMNVLFNAWHGGVTISPRYLIYTIPAWCILAVFFRPQKGFWNMILMLSALLSAFNMFLITVATPLIELTDRNVLYGFLWSNLFNEKIRYIGGWGIKLMAIQNNSLELIRQSQLSLFRYTGTPGIDLLPVAIFSGCLFFLIYRRFELRVWFTSMFSNIAETLHRENLIRISPLLLFTFAGIFLLLILPGDIKWICDEPLLFEIALKHYLAGDLPMQGLTGTFGNAYGPIPCWFYQFCMLLTYDPVIIASIKTVIFGGIIIFTVCRIAKRLSWNPLVPIALFLLSPWTWHYTRILWDNVFLIPFALIALWALIEFTYSGKLFYYILALIMTVCAVWTHSMGLPLLGGVGLYSLILLLRHKKGILSAGLPLGFIGAGILLYRFLTRLSGTGNSFESVPVSDAVIKSFYVCNIFSCNEFLPEHLGESFCQGFFWKIPGYITVFLSGTFLLIGIYEVCKRILKRTALSPADRGAILSAGVLLVHFAYVILLRFSFYSHYLMACIPFILFVIWYAFEECLKSRLKYTVLYIWLSLNMIMLTVFLVFIDLNGGTRNDRFGYLLSNQWELCEKIYPEFRVHKKIYTESFGLYSYVPKTPQVLLTLKAASHSFLKDGNLRFKDTALIIRYFYSGKAPSAFIGVQCCERPTDQPQK